MEKLRKKIFLIISLMLTIFLIIILFIFNYQTYTQEKNETQRQLTIMEDNKNGLEKSENLKENKDENNVEDEETNPKGDFPVFMDTIAYTVIYNSNNDIIDILNHSQNNNISNEEIEQIAKEILNNKKEKNIYIGNLYLEKYSYSYKGINSLTIIDNTKIQNKLLSSLKTSIEILILMEIIIIIISIKITSWIIKPVIESFNKQKQFIADASHELKTPVAVIMANAEALENDPNEKKWLNNIRSESERMNDLITDLLDLAKLENRAELEKYKIEDLSQIVKKEVLTFESLMYENNIKLRDDIKENIKLNCNTNQMKQLVAILLDNGIQHSEKNGEINVTLNKEKNNIVLKVTNKGKEIPKELQEKIFERFYRADESRNRNNNRYGLGLAIAKNIVINHNGTIAIQSEKGYTTFKVIFKA